MAQAVPPVDPVGGCSASEPEPNLFRAIHYGVLVYGGCDLEGRDAARIITSLILNGGVFDDILNLLFLLGGLLFSNFRSPRAPTFKLTSVSTN
jgi:hypothetical protein